MEPGAVLFIVGIVAVAGFLIWLYATIQRQRREEFMRVAAGLGLTYERDDPFDTVDLPFALFSRGEGRGVENVLHGEAAGMKVRLFDYWYYEEVHNTNGPNTRSYHRFSCGMAWIDADCPHLTLGHEGLLSRIADKIGFRDIEFESEEFNKDWQVASEDRRFAFAFVDATMMAWLLDEGGVCEYEVVGPLIFCSTGRLKPTEFPNLLEVLRRFRAHVPEVVGSLYPPGRTADA